ncbi:MAG: DUF3426 domain-containing protein [Sterolibacterium sp.]|nr:DUF3426 domain-containing protein [Sterolibacterium sp.]
MMITRCPGCTTAFRVTPEQLKAMHGKVRCGQCQLVFNAIDTLLDMVKEPVASIAALPDLFDQEASLQASAHTDEPVSEILEELPTTPSLSGEPLDDHGWQDERIEPLLHRKVETAPKRHTWAWVLAAALVLLLLLLQVIVYFRVELSVLSPAMKPLLQDLCKPLSCDVPLPRKGDLISIESSDLHPGTSGQLVLIATLKNRAPFAQTYPDIELTLTDINDQPLLRKILAPADYLPISTDVATGFVAQGELAVNLALTYDNTGSAVASGYRLYLFYP